MDQVPVPAPAPAPAPAPSSTSRTSTTSKKRSTAGSVGRTNKSSSGSAKQVISASQRTELKALVAKVKQLAAENSTKQDTFSEQLRSSTSKLLTIVKSQGSFRQVMNSDPSSNFAFVPGILKNCSDVIVIQNVVKLVLECISSKAGNSRLATIQVLVEWDIIGLLFDCLDALRLSRCVCDGAASWLHQLLVEIGTKDPLFPAKAKKVGIKLSCLVLKNINFDAKSFVPILKTFKMYSRVGNACRAALSREQAVSLLIQVLNSEGKRPVVHTTLTLEALSNMCKQKKLCQEAVKCGVVTSALKIVRSWQFVDLPDQIKLCQAALSVLNRVASTGIAVAPIKKAGGLEVVEKFLSSCPSDPPSFDPLLSKAGELFHYIAAKKPLPVPTPKGPFKFVDRKSVTSYITEDDSKSSDTVIADESSSGSELDPLSEASDFANKKASPSPVPSLLLISRNTFQKSSPELEAFANFFHELSVKDAVLAPNGLAFEWGVDRIGLEKRQSMLRFREKAGYTVDMGELDIKVQPLPATRLSSTHIHFPRKTSASSVHLSRGESMAKSSASSVAIPAAGEGANKTKPIGAVLTKERFGEEASKVRSVVPFIKFGYPDFCSDTPSSRPLEKLYEKDRVVCREKMIATVKKITTEAWKPVVVYDLDALGKEEFPDLDPDDVTPVREREVSNDDLETVKSRATSAGPICTNSVKNSKQPVEPLVFESRFESGNLRKVIQVGPREYDLFVSPDIGTVDHHLWFYFHVSNMKANVSYTFNIASCEKSNCQFNFGMKPVLYSVMESESSRSYTWERVGTNICYYTNQYGGVAGKKGSTGQAPTGYNSASFTVQFKHSNDICYMAYHYPYTYTALRCHLEMWKEKAAKNPSIFMTSQTLAKSEAGNLVPLLTITDKDRKDKKPYCLITGRVHPGESNASWVMKGTVDFLVSEHPVAESLRKSYIFKIIPMLNVDGVVNGNGRCSLYGEDLNRRWKSPDPVLHPSIYAAKGLIAYLSHQMGSPPFLYCDFHGHARYKNIFTYGCSPVASWNKADCSPTSPLACDPMEYQGFPLAMHHLCPSFAFEKCDFSVARDRETTARVTVWREFNIPRSYTLESTYCGCAEGPYRGFHIGIRELKESGAKFCEAIYCLDERGKPRLNMRPGVDRRAQTLQRKRMPGVKAYHGLGKASATSERA